MESIRRGFATAQRHDSREGEARLEQHIHQLRDVANIREQVYVQTQGAMEGKQMVVRKTSPDIHQVQHQSRKFRISRVRPSTLSTCPPIRILHFHVMQNMVTSPRCQVPVIASPRRACFLLPAPLSSRASIFLNVLRIIFFTYIPLVCHSFLPQSF